MGGTERGRALDSRDSLRVSLSAFVSVLASSGFAQRAGAFWLL